MEKTFEEIAARELQLYAENSFTVYQRILHPVIENLKKKIEKGIFDKEKAVKAFEHVADFAAQQYHKEFGAALVPWYHIFDKATRRACAIAMTNDFINDYENL
jgi:hypothetical protein